MALAFGKLLALVAVVFVLGSRLLPRALVYVARLQSRELFTLTILAIAITIAAGASALFGASMALGAFLAGMVVGQSPVSQQAAADALPLRDAFAVLFFVSVGMLFEPAFLLREPLLLLAALAVVLIGKPLVALAVVALLGYSVRTALVVALGLAQVGEFSFILGDLAREQGLLSDTGFSLLVACALVSIAVNPFLFGALEPIESRLRGTGWLWRLLNRVSAGRYAAANEAAAAALAGAPEPLAVVVGYGPVGRSVDEALRQAGTPTVVIDLNMDTVAEIRASGRQAIFGDASHAEILRQAGAAAGEPPGRHAAALGQPHADDRSGAPAEPALPDPGARPLPARARGARAGRHERRLLRGGGGGGGAHRRSCWRTSARARAPEAGEARERPRAGSALIW